MLACPRPTCLYEDDDLLVLDKPEGLLSVPGRGPDKQDCLARRAQMHWPDALVVHRLDMATSGLLIFARSKEVQRLLSDAFAARQIGKRYVATVYGEVEHAPDDAWHRVDAPLICDWERRPLQKVDDIFGRPSQTLFQRHPDQAGTPPHCTRIWLEPITGRSHQLRVHMSHIGLPLVGDALYAPAHVLALDQRLHLHASELRFRHPCTNESLHIRSAVPNFFQAHSIR